MRLDLIRQIASKELTLFFASSIGYLFLGAFLLATLFLFFWVETFFARNIADVRPLFEWLPVLLIFLTAALTMRMWSEERRSGTLEFVATLPVSTWEFVVGKFLACWVLLGLALLLTLPLPMTVAVVGDLDWGPVIAGYIAALLLGGAYLAIGLFVSARTDSQIVSLIGSTLVCGLFYLLGSSAIVELFGSGLRDFLISIGSGSRFESITRGMMDFRDLYFYVSVSVAFLALNVFTLERSKWAAEGDASRHRKWQLGSGLLVLNVLLANVWLTQVTALRFDWTEGRIYSISSATEGYLQQLREPLLIRGYFSEKTHPLLSPLVPRLKDLLEEYEVAGDGQVRVEIIDPAEDPELENEANTKYGIRAVPFQIQDRYQASLVNSYMDILIQYGDEYEVLSFRDLIEVKVEGETDIDVQLKNPEFDMTRSIKRVLYGFQGGSSVFANIVDPVEFVGYVSADDVLPEPLVDLKQLLVETLQEVQEEGGTKFSSNIVDPQANDGVIAAEIAANYGFQPMAASLFDDTSFYFYLTLQSADTVVQVPIPEGLSAESLKRGIDEGLKRFASGLLKTVVLSAPQAPPPYMQQQGAPRGNEFNQLEGEISSDFEVTRDDLASGLVPENANVVVVVDPSSFDDKKLFALDQYLMKGGTVVVGAGSFGAEFSQGGLLASARDSGLQDWVQHHGVEIGRSMVMDPQNSAFPIPVTRQAGGFSFQDLVMLDYPYFVDIRGAGLNEDAPMLAGLNQITLTWPSPLILAPSDGIAVTEILRSSEGSWLSTSTDVSPQVGETGISPFVPEGEQASHLLAVALEGQFESYFKGKTSPLLESAEADAEVEPESEEAATETSEGVELGTVSTVIEKSPEAARLIVIGSNDFAADQVLQMVGSATGTLYANTTQLMTNIVDWSVEDQSLIGIRSRGNFNRTLPGMEQSTQSVIEYLNYGFALMGIVFVILFFNSRQKRKVIQQRSWLAQTGGQA
ncbi:MAG: ABC transporter permease subunit [Pseudomonadales bacterium]|nr:ABC transporter permease subunit [Pseudomonadales bacterium]